MPDSSEHIRRKNISIRLATDGFSFATLQGSDHLESGFFTVDPARSMGANLQSMLDKTGLGRKALDWVSVIIPSRSYTLLPEALFEAGKARSILEACIMLKETEEARWDHLMGQSDILLFPVETTIREILEERFPDAKITFTCQSTLLLDMMEKEKLIFRQLMAHYENGLLTLLCKEEGRIRMARTIPAKLSSDTIYYILNAFQSLDMDQEKDYLKLTAREKDLQELLSGLSRFIQNILPVVTEEGHLTLHKKNLSCES